MPLTEAQARPRRQEAASLGIETELVRVDMSYTLLPAARGENIEETVRRVNGLIIRPGGTFSLNQVTGRREGVRLRRPRRADRDTRPSRPGRPGDLGRRGRSCSSAALVKGRPRHRRGGAARDVPAAYPAGREVVVSIRNPTWSGATTPTTGVLIQASAADTVMKVSLWGPAFTVKITQSARTRLRPRPEDQGAGGGLQVPVVGSSGFMIMTTRERVRLDGTAEPPENIKTIYKPRAEIVCPPPKRAKRHFRGQRTGMTRMRSSPFFGSPRPSRLLVPTHNDPSGAVATERRRPNPRPRTAPRPARHPVLGHRDLPQPLAAQAAAHTACPA